MEKVINEIIKNLDDTLFIHFIQTTRLKRWEYSKIFKTIESCSDGIQNQNESEIDCGGPCDPCRKFTLDNYPALFLTL